MYQVQRRKALIIVEGSCVVVLIVGSRADYKSEEMERNGSQPYLTTRIPKENCETKVR